MKTIDFNQRVIVVTGGTGGFGITVVKALLAANARVAATYRNEAKMQQARAALEGLGAVEFFPMDANDIPGMARCVDSILAKMGPIAGLVQLAGSMAGKPGLEITPEEWDTLMDTNAKGTFFFMQAVVGRAMKNTGGAIVNIASMAGIRGMVPPLVGAHYGASKAAVVAITKQAAVEWAELGVRANVIAPGGVKSGPMAGLKKEELPPFMVANVPSRDLVEPECLADTVLYLLSDMSAAMTGQVVILDGGATACGY